MAQRAVARLALPVDEKRDHVQGSSEAPVTLVEYGDYECPHCARAFPVVNTLKRHLGNMLRLVYRHFPLAAIHPHARLAAEAAESAGNQGKFWEMHELLFERHTLLEPSVLLTHASYLNLDRNRFALELARHVHADRVTEDVSGGVRSGVNGTPTFFINGIRHDRAHDFASLLYAIEGVSPGGEREVAP